MNIDHRSKQVRCDNTKINDGTLSHRISVSGVLVNPLLSKKGIHYAKSVGGTELQQTPSVSVNVGVSLSFDDTMSCCQYPHVH